MALLYFLGWRYPGRPPWQITAVVGALSGFLGGAFQIEGPLVAIFWLSSANAASTVRANMMVFISLIGLTACIVYIPLGLLTPEVIALWLILGPLFAVAMWGGKRVFDVAPEAAYRNVVLLLIAVAVIGTLPIPDGWLHWLRF